MYNRIWTLVITDELVFEEQDGNDHNDHAVSVTVKKDGYIIVQIPHSIYSVMFFLHTRGKDVMLTIGTRRLLETQGLLALWLIYHYGLTYTWHLSEADAYSREACIQGNIVLVKYLYKPPSNHKYLPYLL